MPSSPILLTLLAGVAAVIFFYFAIYYKMFGHDPREPPLAPQSIPLVGHMVGMSRGKFNYYVDLSKQVDAPIFTMALPGQKMYVVTKPELVQSVQKQHKVLAFPPIEANFASTVCGASQEAQAILAKNVNGDEGDFGLSMESYEAMRSALKPSPELDDMNRSMIREVTKSLDQLQPSLSRGGSRTLSLYAWLRNAITTATTRSVYGPMNPYDDPEIVDAFWEFESGFMSILIGILPSLTARKPVAARTKVAKAFEKYYKAGGVNQASALAKKRYQAEIDNNVPLADIARYEVGGSIAVLVNTAPAAFWTLLLLHSHPGLLGEIRQEVDACTKTTTTEDGSTLKTLDITTLKESCPLLLSAYQEVLRYRSMGTSVREVMEDTYLDQWLLKKGAMIQIPSRVIHQDGSLWGDDVEEYNPRRFLPEEKKNRPRDVCFRAFGGGKTLCPGRHFATNEILAVVATFVARFDMSLKEGGAWRLPTVMNTNVAAVVMQPDDDIEVEVKLRKGFEDVKWAVNLRESDKIFAMVTEDEGVKSG
ncbi:cytochrome P450 [Xylariaceae sp. FL0594]|nr:cytochrome P450 [Xylariaceae sp. FL0594]